MQAYAHAKKCKYGNGLNIIHYTVIQQIPPPLGLESSLVWIDGFPVTDNLVYTVYDDLFVFAKVQLN